MDFLFRSCCNLFLPGEYSKSSGAIGEIFRDKFYNKRNINKALEADLKDLSFYMAFLIKFQVPITKGMVYKKTIMNFWIDFGIFRS